jgi:hypothetical protein
VREFDADNFDRVTAAKVGLRHRVPSAMQRRTFHKKEMERAVADLPTYKAGDAADLKVSSSAGGSALVKLLLKLVNWVWELETLPTAWSGVIVNLFKAGDTQLPGNYRGSPWYQSAARCLQTCCASRSQCTCTRLRRRSSKRSCTDNLFVLAHPQDLANKLRSFWTCASV